MPSNLLPPTEAPFGLHKEQWMTSAKPEVVHCWEQGLIEYREQRGLGGRGRILSLDINRLHRRDGKGGSRKQKKIEIKNCDAQPPTQDYGTRMSLHGGELA